VSSSQYAKNVLEREITADSEGENSERSQRKDSRERIRRDSREREPSAKALMRDF
jgi:hypothetical protein